MSLIHPTEIEIVSTSESVPGFAPDNSHAVVRMSSEDHSVGEKFCCSDSASP